MTAWQPRRGERVIAVLPDGHEIEGRYEEYGGESLPTYCVVLCDAPREVVIVRTVKPLPVVEPEVFGACVIDRQGKRWIRDAYTRWHREDGRQRYEWRSLVSDFGPMRVVNADPWSES